MNPPAWLFQRTRLLNFIHYLRLVEGHSQMNAAEKAALRKYAVGKENALEIGTYMGVSANIIAKAMAKSGTLRCVDPFLDRKGSKDPGLAIAERDLHRNGVAHKVIILKGFSTDPLIQDLIPFELDFIFIDGDHSYKGLGNDWKIVGEKLRIHGIVCLHDTIIPAEEPYRDFGSVKYFEDVVKRDIRFELIEQCYSMTVLKRLI